MATWQRVNELEEQLATARRWSRAWKQIAKLHRRVGRHFCQVFIRNVLESDAELVEQQGRYDQLLVEHQALRELLHILEANG